MATPNGVLDLHTQKLARIRQPNTFGAHTLYSSPCHHPKTLKSRVSSSPLIIPDVDRSIDSLPPAPHRSHRESTLKFPSHGSQMCNRGRSDLGSPWSRPELITPNGGPAIKSGVYSPFHIYLQGLLSCGPLAHHRAVHVADPGWWRAGRKRLAS